MWTPKRVVLLALSFCGFFSGYMFYANALGGIDGLPPLPMADYPPDGTQPMEPLTGHGPYKLDEKLSQAFGPGCPELKWPLKLEMNSRNMIVAASEFKILDAPDGRLRLDKLSIALFGKDQGDGRDVEINTLRAQQAFLTFDKPLGKDEKDFTGRHIVAAELLGDKEQEIVIVNNHGRKERDRALHLRIPNGPLYYDESKSLIWTEDNVFVEDDQDQPPATVTGKGMEVHLTAEPRPDGKTPRGKPKESSFTGVDRIVVKADVVMNLYVAAGGFLADEPKPAAKAATAPAPAAKQEKAKLFIMTPGRFEYDFRKDGDLAQFETPDADPAARVSVSRFNPSADGKDGPPSEDKLLCRRLELRLRNKGAAAGAHDDHTPEHNLEVENAHAVAARPAEVVVTSDGQRTADGKQPNKMEARGNDFLYDARTKLTILKGDPENPNSQMWANQDGNEIHARELQIQEVGPEGKTWRQVIALGPGRIDLKNVEDGASADTKKAAAGNAEKKPAPPPIHASWLDTLTSTKDGTQDLLILRGKAAFVDDEHDQTLRADTLKVWLLAPEDGAPAAGQPGDRQTRRPSRVEAIGVVSARSPQMIIPKAAHLVVQFRDVPADELPAPAPAAKDGTQAKNSPAPVAGPGDKAPPQPGRPVGPAPPAPAAPPAASAQAAAPAKEEPDRPVELEARTIEAWVDRAGDKSALQKLWAEGAVLVNQAPAKPDEKGVHIEGDTLEMTCHPEGNLLFVIGDLAQLRMDDIAITGPDVTIDQAANTVLVKGAGGMQMMSKSNFQGEPLPKPVPLSVIWSKEMFFNGRHAEFTGGEEGVQAEQENAHLACQTLHVNFDRTVSLKEGNRGGPPPRVQGLVCDKSVVVDDKTLEGNKVVRYQQIIARSLTMNALEPDGPPKPGAGGDGNEVLATAPGELRLFQQGGQDPLAAPPGPGAKPPAAKPNEPMKITYVRYGDNSGAGSMYANTRTNKANFLVNVRVLNMPCDDPHMEIDLDAIRTHMPEGAMYLQSDRLDVIDRGDKKKSRQEMTATGHVQVQAKDYWGSSDEMTYDEAKDQIIFKGKPGNTATLYKRKQRGGEAQKIEGKTIIYIRSTGMFQIEGGEWISGN